MKIISKHKDYYDYLAGIYGIDPLKVYDRRTEHLVKPETNSLSLETYDIAICGMIYRIYQYGKRFYHTEDELFKLMQHSSYESLVAKPITNIRYYKEKDRIKEMKKEIREQWFKHNRSTEINNIMRKPVLVHAGIGPMNDDYQDGDHSWEVPSLKHFRFARYMTPEIIYQKIEQFLGWLNDNPPAPDNQTNKGKIVSHGFDTKISFRHRL